MKLSKEAKFFKKVNNFLFDHYRLTDVLDNISKFFFGTVAAIIFAFGFCCFITPASSDGFVIVTGGVSGLTQNIALILRMFDVVLSNNIVQAIGYFAINVPILTFAFFKIGKKFAIHSLINVVISSLLIHFFPVLGFSTAIASSELLSSSLLARVIFAAICTGVSSALAFKVGISCGGVDVITYYLALRKSTSVGKYGVLFNSVIVTLYASLLIVSKPNDYPTGILSIFYSVSYLFIVSLIVDLINVRNKKIQIQLISSNTNLPHILVANFPHAATVLKGQGVYSGRDVQVTYMIVSSTEINKVIKLARKVDPHVFISVSSLVQVYGKFYIKPVS